MSTYYSTSTTHTFSDLPTISLRPIILPLLRTPDSLHDYFAKDGWGNPDLRHIGVRGHESLGDLVGGLLSEAWGEAKSGFSWDALEGGQLSSEERKMWLNEGDVRGDVPAVRLVLPWIFTLCVSSKLTDLLFSSFSFSSVENVRTLESRQELDIQ